MVPQKRRKAQAQDKARSAIETAKSMLIGRSLLAIGLGGFWILVGYAAGYPTAGAVTGILAACFIFCWSHPSRVGIDP